MLLLAEFSPLFRFLSIWTPRLVLPFQLFPVSSPHMSLFAHFLLSGSFSPVVFPRLSTPSSHVSVLLVQLSVPVSACNSLTLSSVPSSQHRVLTALFSLHGFPCTEFPLPFSPQSSICPVLAGHKEFDTVISCRSVTGNNSAKYVYRSCADFVIIWNIFGGLKWHSVVVFQYSNYIYLERCQ